jgi:hypothetical protein
VHARDERTSEGLLQRTLLGGCTSDELGQSPYFSMHVVDPTAIRQAPHPWSDLEFVKASQQFGGSAWLLELLEGDRQFVAVAELIVKISSVRDGADATVVAESDVIVTG